MDREYGDWLVVGMGGRQVTPVTYQSRDVIPLALLSSCPLVPFIPLCFLFFSIPLPDRITLVKHPPADHTRSDLTSTTSALHVSVYDRSREGEGFLGMLDIKPILKDGYTLDAWCKLGTRGQEHVTGEVWLQVTYNAIRVSRCVWALHTISGVLGIGLWRRGRPRRTEGMRQME